MANKLYPVGIQNFEIIRKEDYLYVDKTAYVYHLTHDNGKSFLCVVINVLTDVNG